MTDQGFTISSSTSAVLLWFLLADSAAAEPANLQRFLAAPAHSVGESVATITRKLGDARGAAFELTPNIHDPALKNVRVTLEYPGCSFVVLVALSVDRSFIERVTLTDPAAASALGVEWFASSDEIQHNLGTPQERSSAEMLYQVENDVGIDTVTFRISEGKVSSVEWQYFID